MFTPIIQLLQKNRRSKLLFISFCFALLSLYPIYKNFYIGRAVTTYERHVALVRGNSEYFNPWQYRMLSPIIVEGLMWTYNHTIDKIYPIEDKINFHFTQTSEPTPETKEILTLLNTKGAVKYMIVFIGFRFLLNFLVFTLAFCLWRHFVKNHWLIFLGLMFLSLAMGNAVSASDLTFNTYLDNVFYLIAACFIIYKRNPYYFLPLTFFAALNRETSMLIPFLFFMSHVDFSKFSIRNPIGSVNFPPVKIWLLTGAMLVIFAIVFVGMRVYYGYQSPQIWKVPPGIQMLKLNLASAVAVKSYFEMLGVFSVIPFVILYRFKSFPIILKVWFMSIIPIWFSIHLYSVVTYQTRLFLVPTILILLPMFLNLIERKSSSANLPSSRPV